MRKMCVIDDSYCTDSNRGRIDLPEKHVFYVETKYFYDFISLFLARVLSSIRHVTYRYDTGILRALVSNLI